MPGPSDSDEERARAIRMPGPGPPLEERRDPNLVPPSALDQNTDNVKKSLHPDHQDHPAPDVATEQPTGQTSDPGSEQPAGVSEHTAAAPGFPGVGGTKRRLESHDAIGEVLIEKVMKLYTVAELKRILRQDGRVTSGKHHDLAHRALALHVVTTL